MNNDVLVSVCCITYNHELYIRECLEGFLRQKTNFNFQILIHDDASTDGTRNIILEYEKKFPGIIKPIYQIENQYSKGGNINARFQYPRVNTKYVALCEGDDYWTDPYKLQKQVDFLEKNSNYGMVYTKVRYFYNSKNKFSRHAWGGPSTSFDDLINYDNKIPTLSTVFRYDLWKDYRENIQPENKNWLMGDYCRWLYFALKSNIYFLDEETAVYRVLEESASHSKNILKQEAFAKSYFDIKRYFLNYANIEYDKAELSDSLLASLAGNAIMMGELKRAKEYFNQIENISIQNRIKKIMCNFSFFSYWYRVKNTN